MKKLSTLFLITAVALISSTLLIASTESEEKIPFLTVSGQSEISVPANRIQINIAVITISKTAQKAMDQNKEKMNKLYKDLDKVGLSKEEYKTYSYNITPNYTPRPRKIPKDWERKIINYTLTNTVRIKTTKLDLSGKIIQTSTKAGANKIDSISFDLSNPQEFKGKAIALAAKNAMSDADALAIAAGVKLIRKLSVVLGSSYAQPPMPISRSVNFMSIKSVDAAPRIEPGNMKISASVTIKYQIGE